MLSAESTAIPIGRLNWPSPEPNVPHVVTNAPAGVNFSTRLSPLSTT
jgi:hypothetical protein